MEQSQMKQEQGNGCRRWAGESLWEGQSAMSRTVEVTALDSKRFRAVGRVGSKQAFEVALRRDQLWRFRRQMERVGTVLQGMPSWTEPGSNGEPPPQSRRGGPINTGGIEKPPADPTKPANLAPDLTLTLSPTDPVQPPPENGEQPKGIPPDPKPASDEKPLPLLLMADLEGRRPVLPPDALGLDAIGHVPELDAAGRLPRPEHLGNPGRDPNLLSAQRWGVIAPRGSLGDELLEAIRPLMELRAEQQGAPVRTYRVAPGGGVAEANEWVRRTYRSESVPEEERPEYLLILGDLADVSADLQQRLGTAAFVGRLCFDSPAGYRAYVDKVLRHEKAPPRQAARSLFFTTHDGTDATSTGYGSLVAPALELCDAVPRRDFPVREVLEVSSPDDWSRARLLEAAGDGSPGVLFTLSHGLGLPRGKYPAEVRRRMQGAMWFGKKDEPLTAEHVASGPFMPGGAWFFLACLSAGTPSRSAYWPWLERLQANGEYGGRVKEVLDTLPGPGEPPFVAALPRAALANPDGPLAIVGHLDLAWTYSFLDPYGARRPARFVEVAKQLWAGSRAGVATKTLLRFASEAEGELMGMAQDDAEAQVEKGRQPRPETVHRGHLWMARNDLIGYLLLGDPAVRIAPAPARD